MSMSPVRKHASPPASEEREREREKAREGGLMVCGTYVCLRVRHLFASTPLLPHQKRERDRERERERKMGKVGRKRVRQRDWREGGRREGKRHWEEDRRRGRHGRREERG